MSFANADSVHEENSKSHGIQAVKEPRKTYTTPRITPQQYQRNFTENNISYKITKRKRYGLLFVNLLQISTFIYLWFLFLFLVPLYHFLDFENLLSMFNIWL